MTSPTKTFKRLGIVGAAAVVGLVPIGVLSSSAYAVSAASLTLGSTVPGQTTSATNTFTVTNSFAGTAPETVTVTANGGESLPSSLVDYSVTVGGVADSLTAASSTPGGADSTSTLALTNAVTAGQQVVVTVTGVVNPTASPSSVYFTDQASSDTNLPAANTNIVTVAGAAAAAATVTSVNPQAFAAGTNGAAGTMPAGFTIPTLPATDAGYTLPNGEQFTVMGSGFSTTGTTPTVCFIPTTITTIPSSCAGTGVVAVTNTPGTTASTYALDVVSSTELQGIVSGLAAGTDYNVVVYNSGAAPSATSAATTVAVSDNTSATGGTIHSWRRRRCISQKT